MVIPLLLKWQFEISEELAASFNSPKFQPIERGDDYCFGWVRSAPYENWVHSCLVASREFAHHNGIPVTNITPEMPRQGKVSQELTHFIEKYQRD